MELEELLIGIAVSVIGTFVANAIVKSTLEIRKALRFVSISMLETTGDKKITTTHNTTNKNENFHDSQYEVIQELTSRVYHTQDSTHILLSELLMVQRLRDLVYQSWCSLFESMFFLVIAFLIMYQVLWFGALMVVLGLVSFALSQSTLFRVREKASRYDSAVLAGMLKAHEEK